MVLAEEEHERGGTVERARTDQAAPSTEAFDAVVAGAGLAAHHQRRAVMQLEAAGDPPRCTSIHHLRHRALQGPGHIHRKDPLAAVRVADQLGFVGVLAAK